MFHAECKDKKAKLFLHIPWKNGGKEVLPNTLTLAQMGWAVSITPQLLYSQEKDTWYLLNRRLGGLQSWSGCFGKDNPLSLLQIKPQLIQSISKIYWLHHPSNFSCKTYVMKLALHSEYNWFSAIFCKYEMFLSHNYFKNKQFIRTCVFWYIFMSFTLQCAC